MSKIIYTGLESSGKSLKLAMKIGELVYRNSKWKKISGKERPIYSNLQFSEFFVTFAQEEMGVPIKYWKDIDELPKLENADVIIDEVGNYFDSRMWADLSLDVRRWLSQGAKTGIEVYGTAQDFAQVDKSFRRLVNQIYEIQKIVGSPRPAATRPPVTKIWGLCLVWELDPRAYSEDDKKYVSQLPHLLFIERKYCEIFDTTQKIVASKPAPLKHVERNCPIIGCTYHVRGKVVHV